MANQIPSDYLVNIIANASRLIRDAKLLKNNDRFASAFALAILGLEEIGKASLEDWENVSPVNHPKHCKTAHLKKQTAVASLLLAQIVVDQFSPDQITPEASTKNVNSLAQAMFESEAGRFAVHTQMGAVDKTKQLALYFDEWTDDLNLHADQFVESDVTDLFEKALQATHSLERPRVNLVARTIYEAASSPIKVGN